MDASHTLSHMDIFLSRRRHGKGYADDMMREAAIEANCYALSELIPIICDNSGNLPDPLLRGRLAELSISGLIAYDGKLVYPASDRENGSRFKPLNHDCYVIEPVSAQKVPIQVKSKYIHNDGYDESKVLVLSYVTICLQVAASHMQVHERPTINRTAILLANAIVKQATGVPVTQIEQDMLETGARLVNNTLDNFSSTLIEPSSN